MESPTPSAEEVRHRAGNTVARVSLALGLVAATAALVHGINDVKNHAFEVGDETPSKLPPAVSRLVQDAVLLEEVEKDGTTILSGVDLGDGVILSAAHAFKSANGTVLAQSSWCSNYVIRGVAENGEAYNAPANQCASEYSERGETDLAIFRFTPETLKQLAAKGAILPENHTLQIATTPPKAGDTVYFINWEPTETDIRDPLSGQAELAKPVVYAGEILSADNKVATVVTSIRGYDIGGVSQDYSVPGSSGGMVVTGDGKLIGISNRANVGNNALSYVVNAKIGPFGLPDGGDHISYVNLLGPAEIESWAKLAEMSPVCEYTNPFPNTSPIWTHKIS